MKRSFEASWYSLSPCGGGEPAAKVPQHKGKMTEIEREKEGVEESSSTFLSPDFSHTYPHERGNISMVQLLQRRSISPAAASGAEQVSRRECTLHLN